MSLLTPKVQPGQFPQEFHYQPGQNDMVLQFTSGANGAVPSPFNQANGVAYFNGIESLTRDAQGLYSMVVDSIWTALFDLEGSINLASGTYAATVALGVKAFSWDLPNRTIKFATYRLDTGVATDMSAGDILTLFTHVGWQAKNTPGLGI